MYIEITGCTKFYIVAGSFIPLVKDEGRVKAASRGIIKPLGQNCKKGGKGRRLKERGHKKKAGAEPSSILLFPISVPSPVVLH